MPSSNSTFSEVILQRVRTKYRWPALQLNFWIFVMLIASCTILGIFANFITIQSQLDVGTPWYFPYWVTVGGLGVVFLLVRCERCLWTECVLTPA